MGRRRSFVFRARGGGAEHSRPLRQPRAPRFWNIVALPALRVCGDRATLPRGDLLCARRFRRNRRAQQDLRHHLAARRAHHRDERRKRPASGNSDPGLAPLVSGQRDLSGRNPKGGVDSVGQIRVPERQGRRPAAARSVFGRRLSRGARVGHARRRILSWAWRAAGAADDDPDARAITGSTPTFGTSTSGMPSTWPKALSAPSNPMSSRR